MEACLRSSHGIPSKMKIIREDTIREDMKKKLGPEDFRMTD